MFFPIAGIEVDLWIPPVVAFGISFFTSMGGISGAFLLLPFQMSFLGYTHPSVSATNHVYNVVAIPSGIYRFWHEGRMVWPLAWVVILGTLPGVFAGALLRVAHLPDPRHFKLFAAGVLLFIGLKTITDNLARKDRSAKLIKQDPQPKKIAGHNVREQGGGLDASGVTTQGIGLRRLVINWHDQSFIVSTWQVFMLSLVVGLVGGVYGIGGGAIIAPFLVTFFRLPVHIVAGAALMGTFVTSTGAVLFYQAIAPYYAHLSVAPDWVLGILFGLGGTVGMYLGARCQKHVPAQAIKWMLAVILLSTALQYGHEFFRN